MPLVRPFETSFGRTTERQILLVQVEDSDGAIGWGEVTCGERPFYNEEWVDAAWLVLRDFVAPRVLGRELHSAAEVGGLSLAIRGHRMARAGLEAACWELEARKLGRPLWQHIGGARREVACGVSIGIQNSVSELLEVIGAEVEAGYQRIKIKIKPGRDADVVREVRRHFPDIRLMADANSAYTLDDLESLQGLGRIRPDDAGTTVGARRIDRSCRVAGPVEDSDLLGRVHPHGSSCPPGDPARCVPHHQRQARPRRRVRRSFAHSRCLP